MFRLIDFIYHYVGNFGVAILIVTVLVKAVFFPLANQSYRSMAKMKLIQPKIAALKELYPDDRQKQQQAQLFHGRSYGSKLSAEPAHEIDKMRAVANDGDFFGLDKSEIRGVVVVEICHIFLLGRVTAGI